MSYIAFTVILKGVDQLITSLRRRRSNVQEALRVYAGEENALLEFPVPTIIPSLLKIVGEMQLWPYVCLGMLLLSRACLRLKLNDEIRTQIIQTILTAYEPPSGSDSGTTQAVRLLSLSALGFEPAVHTLKVLAQQEHTDVNQFANELFANVIQALAESSEQ